LRRESDLPGSVLVTNNWERRAKPLRRFVSSGWVFVNNRMDIIARVTKNAAADARCTLPMILSVSVAPISGVVGNTPTALRNIVCNIGDIDSERFHSKLKKKIEWVRGTSLLKHLPEESFVGVIILDRVFPGMNGGKYIVSDLESITVAIDRSLSQRTQAQTGMV
jgi:hypothetical protein